MKQSRAVVDARREQILQIIEKTGDARVEDIAGLLGVSEITIRRDLQYLEDRKKLKRYYGGATVRTQITQTSGELREVRKEMIARYAATLVEDDDTLFINTSSTAIRIAPYITARNVTVITNNGNILQMKMPHSVTVILTGGELRNVKGTMVGEFALHNLEKVTATKAFIGCSGLSLTNGMMTQFLNEVDLNRMMLERTGGPVYVLADHTKLGRDSSFQSFGIDRITRVITDVGADAALLTSLRERGIEVTEVRG